MSTGLHDIYKIVMEYFDFDEFKVKGKITNLKIDENIT